MQTWEVPTGGQITTVHTHNEGARAQGLGLHRSPLLSPASLPSLAQGAMWEVEAAERYNEMEKTDSAWGGSPALPLHCCVTSGWLPGFHTEEVPAGGQTLWATRHDTSHPLTSLWI